MPDQFQHGPSHEAVGEQPPPISVESPTVFGVVGTAPGADETVFPYNTPVLVASQLTAAKLYDDETGTADKGTLPGAVDTIFKKGGARLVVIRVEEGVDEDDTMANVIGGVDSGSGAYTGTKALLVGKAMTGYRPSVLMAPGWTHQRENDGGSLLNNPVVAELSTLSDRLFGVVLADGPDAKDADAFAYATDLADPNVFVVDPRAGIFDTDAAAVVDRYGSSVAAGILSQINYWESPSNKRAGGVVSTSRPIDYIDGDPNSRANLLNEQNVTTIINEDGWRLWGNRCTDGSFLSVQRTLKTVDYTILTQHRWAVDQGLTPRLVDDVVDRMNGFFDNLTATGAILGGSAWLNTELTTTETIKQGIAYYDYEMNPVYPLENPRFRRKVTDKYIVRLFE